MDPIDARKTSRITLILFIVSFFIHLGAVLAIHHYRNPIIWENGNIAGYLYKGEGFRIDYYGLTAEPTSVQAPGYPVLLWGAWELFGQTPRAYLFISVLQCLAVASMVWPMGWLSRRWFPEAPPWIAQALVVVYPLYIWYSTRVHHTALVMAMHPWLLWAWIACCRKGPWQGIATGILSAVAGLFQPVLMGVYAIVGAFMLASALLKKNWKVATNLLLAALAVVVCLTPWTIRNYKVHGRFILVKDGFAKELWMGNNAHATGTSFAEGGAGEITNVYPPKAYAQLGKIHEIAMDDALWKEAVSYMKANPGRTVQMTLKKLRWFWTVPPRDLERTFGEGEAVKYRSIDIAYWGAVVALTVLGIATARHPLKEYLWIVVLYVLVYSTIYGLTHVGQTRFRGEMEYVFLFAVGGGLSFLLHLAWRNPRPAASAQS